MQHAVVSQKEWLTARKALLAKEKEFTKTRDQLSEARRSLPWVKVEENYVFEGPAGKESCSFLADHFDGAVVHLAQRDVTLVVVSRAPLAEIDAYKKRMGWKFKWVSSFGNDFNHDFHVSFTPEEKAGGKVEYNYTMTEFPSEEAPGLSVFIRNEGGEVLHTYSSYARGLDILVGTYNFLDFAPKGRDEGALPWTMAWVRRHDEYGK
jgi:predicted dithiol-disulfide oxidoreductase (DUF899 family)